MIRHHKKILFFSITLVLVGIVLLIWFFLTYKESFKNFDPKPPDYSLNSIEAKKRRILLVKYKPEFKNYSLKNYNFSILDSWLENYDDDQKQNRKDTFNLKFILLIQEKNDSDSFFDINWSITENIISRIENRGVNNQKYYIVLHSNNFISLDTLTLELTYSQFAKDLYGFEIGKIKLIKVK
jgi:hypothetical protein